MKEGLGGSVVQCLAREEPIIPKSSIGSADQRPTAYKQYRTMEVTSMLTEPKEILLVDDVVTRGQLFWERPADLPKHAHMRT